MGECQWGGPLSGSAMMIQVMAHGVSVPGAPVPGASVPGASVPGALTMDLLWIDVVTITARPDGTPAGTPRWQ